MGYVFRHVLLQVPPLDLQRHGRRADSLEGARHLHILSLPHTHIFRDLSKCSFGVYGGEQAAEAQINEQDGYMKLCLQVWWPP